MIFVKKAFKPLRDEIASQRERLLADAKRREQEDKLLENQRSQGYVQHEM
ncbi:hypothetical protein KUL150_11440 [Alteromonas sp. KUL150]|nr:hypothetical protein [Alteromonas sp. KUL150]GFD85085.1 hypothetical protein KUL150_11440 [Alteromonas sp. KUL150]|tara:strand:- start:1450 stop:1599 length:150 start_codon:yes stop_codon:yes gene_type:complete